MKGEPINIEWMFDKIAHWVSNDDLSIRTINCLNYYRYLENQSNSQKNKQTIIKQLKMFKVFSKKINDIFHQILESNFEAKGNIDKVKEKIEQRQKNIFKYLSEFNQPLREENNRKNDNKNSIRNKQQDDENDFDEMMGGLQNISDNARRMSKLLAEGDAILYEAKTNQDFVYDKLEKVTKSITNMLSNPDLSLFKLVFMSIIALLLFLFTALFIIAF